MFAEINCGWYNDLVSYIASYAADPARPLNYWDYYGNAIPDYGKATIYMMYLAEHFGGNEIVGQLAQNTMTGFAGIQNTVQTAGYSTDFSSIFLDWIIANFIDNPTIGDGEYGYPTYDFSQFTSTKFL